MPIPSEELTTSSFLVLPADTTVRDALARLPARRSVRAYVYLVVPLPDGTYLVPRWVEVELLALAAGRDITGTRLADLPTLLGQIDPAFEIPMGGKKTVGKKLRAGDLQRRFAPVSAVEQDDTSLPEARRARDRHPASRLVVLNAGTVVGLFVTEMLSGADLPRDPFARGPAVLGDPTSDVTPPPLPAMPLEPGAEAPRPDEYVVNFWTEEPTPDGSRRQPQTLPLKERTVYELKIKIDLPYIGGFTFVAGSVSAMFERATDDAYYDLTVIVESADVTIYGSTEQVLVVKRDGASKNAATFTIETKQAGQAKMTAFLIAGGQVLQRVDFTLQVGGSPGKRYLEGTVTRGLTLTSMPRLQRREPDQRVNLMIIKRENGYQFVLQSGGVTRAFIPLDVTAIGQLIDEARKRLASIVKTQSSLGDYVYTDLDTHIPEDVHKNTLRQLAPLGFLLYQKLFFGPNAGADARAMGALLRRISQREQLQIQVVAEQFIFPWTLLYDRERVDPNNVDETGFWGFRHIIEYLPEFGSPTTVSFDPVIQGGDRLTMACLFNTRIDAEMQDKGFPPNSVVVPQREFYAAQLPGVQVTTGETTMDLYNLLNNPDAPPLIYIYCHAESQAVGARGGTYSSQIILSDGSVTLFDLETYAPVSGEPTMKNAPLVFLNACQGAELDPRLYDGLVPALLARGARGVIGTEVDTPVYFAAEFARAFYTEFTRGDRRLGELLLELRQRYLREQRNVMGLVYALYSNGDVIVER